MDQLHDKNFPGESPGYREARDRLLEAEIKLREQIEEVASQRRKLPLGGRLKEDYLFEEGPADLLGPDTSMQTKFSDLFEDGRNSLIIYSFMYAPEADNPCPACTSLMDALNGSAPHIQDRVNFVVVAKAPLSKFRSWARDRGWDNLRLLSSGGNSYNTDYFSENPDGGQLPATNVFQKSTEGIHHFYNTELLYAPSDPGQHARHADLIWPLWSLFDMTPDGRGTDWFPKLQY